MKIYTTSTVASGTYQFSVSGYTETLATPISTVFSVVVSGTTSAPTSTSTSTSTSTTTPAASLMSGSLTDCQNFANNFDQTCGSSTPVSFTTMTGVSESCQTSSTCPDGSYASPCTWTRQLCVTCSVTNGLTFMRVQTNALPNHCYEVSSGYPKATNIDFEVVF